MSGNRTKLAAVGRRGGAAGSGRRQASRDITAELQRLQSARRNPLDVHTTLEGLVPGLSGLLDRGYLCSLCVTRDGGSVRMSVLVDGDWVELYCTDPDSAADIGDGVLAALSGSQEPPPG